MSHSQTCQTLLRTCKIWPGSLRSTWVEKTLIFLSVLLPLPAKVSDTNESAAQSPPSHSTSLSSSITITSQPLFLHNFPLFLIPFSLHATLQSLLPSLFFFTPVMLFLLTWLLKFLKFRGKLQKQIRKCLTTNKTCRDSEADLNLLLTSYTLGFFPLCTRISKRCWKVGSPGEHKRTYRNAQPCFEIQSQTYIFFCSQFS